MICRPLEMCLSGFDLSDLFWGTLSFFFSFPLFLFPFRIAFSF